MRARALPALLALLTLATAACGITPEGDTHRIAADNVPQPLLEPAPTTTSTTRPSDVVASSTTVALATVPLYLVRDGRFELVLRETTASAGVKERVFMLSPPLRAEDEAKGYRSAVPAGSIANVVETTEGYAIVDLASIFINQNATDQALGFAQITYTLTAVAGIGQVSFTYEGREVEVVAADGTIVSGNRVTRSTYAALLASRR